MYTGVYTRMYTARGCQLILYCLPWIDSQRPSSTARNKSGDDNEWMKVQVGAFLQRPSCTTRLIINRHWSRLDQPSSRPTRLHAIDSYRPTRQ